MYWIDTGDGSVNSVAKTGGAVVPLASNQSGPAGIAVDDTYVYWSNNLGGAVWRTLKSGNDTAHLVAAVTSPTTILVDSTYIYVIDGNSSPVTSFPSQSMARAPKDGSGTATAFSSVQAFGVFPVVELGENGTSLYAFATPLGASAPAVYQIALTTGATTRLNPPAPLGGSAFAIGYNLVGVTQGGDFEQDNISWLDLLTSQSGHSPSLAEVTNNPVHAIAAAPCGFVLSAPEFNLVTLGALTYAPLFATASPTQIVVDGLFVYWTDTSGAIGKLPLP